MFEVLHFLFLLFTSAPLDSWFLPLLLVRVDACKQERHVTQRAGGRLVLVGINEMNVRTSGVECTVLDFGHVGTSLIDDLMEVDRALVVAFFE